MKILQHGSTVYTLNLKNIHHYILKVAQT
uniref:Uncharacterized protein n=1 Tax=Arundo donax TaxID=35708 RepID=A0A0A9H549_ARUDO